MLKMLRVVRVMRFFRALRMMVASIMGSIATLFWSIMMLTLMMYIFGLCFLQAVIGYLEEDRSVDSETLVSIQRYWSSVVTSTITLYMAITGGSDWEVLAEPLKKAGPFYYGLFLFYISFAAVAVLNVLTGMFVDSAMKVCTVEDDAALQQVLDQDQEVVHDFYNVFRRIGVMHETGLMSWKEFNLAKDCQEVQGFFKTLDITLADARLVFNRMQINGEVKFNEFVLGCSKIKDDIRALDIIGLSCDNHRLHAQMSQLMEYVQDQFDEMHMQLKTIGMPASSAVRLQDRLRKHACLPSSWGHTHSTESEW